MKYFPEWFNHFIIKKFPPVVVTKINGVKKINGEEIEGVVIGFAMTAKQMMNDRELAQKKIVDCLKYAEKLGVKIAGLGALTSSLTRGGLDLVGKTEVIVTTGHALTVATVTENIFSIVSKLNLDISKEKIAIVGAAGSVGSTSFKRLAEKGARFFVLIDLKHKNERLEKIATEARNKFRDINIDISNNTDKIKGARFIITATNAPDAVIKSIHLSSGSIIIDDAQPSDISTEIIKEREDIVVIEAGTLHVPNIKYKFDFGLKHKEDVFSCLGEIITLSAFDKIESFSLGWLEAQKVEEIWSLAQKLDIRIAEYQNFHKTYIIEDIKRVLEKNT